MKRFIIALSFIVALAGAALYFYLTKQPVHRSSLDLAIDAMFKSPTATQPSSSINSTKKANQVFANPISLQQCSELFSKNNSLQQVEARKRLEIAKAVADLKSGRTSFYMIGILADLSGLKKAELEAAISRSGGYYRDGASGNGIFSLRDRGEERISLNEDEKRIIRQVEKTKNYSEVEKAVRDKVINPNATIGAKSLLANFIDNNKAISLEQLDGLLKSGLPVKPDSLAFGIASGLSLDHIKLLVESNPENVKATWLDDTTASNAMITSAKYLRNDLYEYFSAQGGATSANNRAFGGQTVLDALPKPKNEQELQSVESIARLALEQNTRATLHGTKERLDGVLSTDIAQQYATQLVPEQPLDPQIKAKAEQLKTIVLNSDESILLIKRDIERCSEQHEYTIDTYFTELTRSGLASSDMSLESKTEYFKYLQRELKKHPELNVDPALRSVIEGMKNYPNREELKAVFSGYMELLKSKNWSGAVAAADDMKTKNLVPGMERLGYGYLINAYLKESNPDPQFVRQLLDNGAILNFTDIEDALRRNNLAALKNFNSFGLDLNTTNVLGQNALDIAISRRASLETIDFLLQNGTSAKSATMGLDALDRALQSMESFQSQYSDPNEVAKLNQRFKSDVFTKIAEYPVVVDRLIRAGAPIEHSHIDQIMILKATNPDAYAKLLEIIPNLDQLLPNG